MVWIAHDHASWHRLTLLCILHTKVLIWFRIMANEQPNKLGKHIRNVRQLLGLSLAAAAEKARISAAYQKKLESGDVKQPSPTVLHAVAEALGLEYATLMGLAGYLVPEQSASNVASSFDHALNSADLSDSERKAVAAYIALLRQQRDSG